MREVEKNAGSVEEAIEAALEDLGVSEQEVEVEIIREPEKGFLGLRAVDAVVKVRVREGAEAEGQAIEEQAEIAEEFVVGFLERIGMDAEVDHHVVDEVMYVDVVASADSEGMGILIGRHGQTLDALQEVVRCAVQRITTAPCRVVVDIEDYRKRRRAQLAERAREVARRVRRSGKAEALEPMTPYERKIVHDAAGEVGGVETVSEGEEGGRRVVVSKKR